MIPVTSFILQFLADPRSAQIRGEYS